MSIPFELWIEGNEEGGMIFMDVPDGGSIPMGVAPENLKISKWIAFTCNRAWCEEMHPSLPGMEP